LKLGVNHRRISQNIKPINPLNYIHGTLESPSQTPQ